MQCDRCFYSRIVKHRTWTAKALRIPGSAFISTMQGALALQVCTSQHCGFAETKSGCKGNRQLWMGTVSWLLGFQLCRAWLGMCSSGSLGSAGCGSSARQIVTDKAVCGNIPSKRFWDPKLIPAKVFCEIH